MRIPHVGIESEKQFDAAGKIPAVTERLRQVNVWIF
jgi:hypothetical protein